MFARIDAVLEPATLAFFAAGLAGLDSRAASSSRFTAKTDPPRRGFCWSRDTASVGQRACARFASSHEVTVRVRSIVPLSILVRSDCGSDNLLGSESSRDSLRVQIVNRVARPLHRFRVSALRSSELRLWVVSSRHTCVRIRPQAVVGSRPP